MEPRGNLEQQTATLNIKQTNKNQAMAVTGAEEALKMWAEWSWVSCSLCLNSPLTGELMRAKDGYEQSRWCGPERDDQHHWGWKFCRWMEICHLLQPARNLSDVFRTKGINTCWGSRKTFHSDNLETLMSFLLCHSGWKVALKSKHFDTSGAHWDALSVSNLFSFTGNAFPDTILFQSFFQRAVAFSAILLQSLHKSSTTLLYFHPTVQLSFEVFKWMHLGN